MTTVFTEIDVRFLIDSEIEAEGILTESAADRVWITTNVTITKGAHIVFYLPSGGRFEGTTLSANGSRVEVRVNNGAGRLEKLSALVAFHQEQGDGANAMSRRAAPRAEKQVGTRCELHDKTSLPCTVQDVSLSGLGIAVEPVLKIGQVVRVGKVVAKVVRKTSFGYGLAIMPHDTPLGLSDASSTFIRPPRFALGALGRSAASG